MKDEILQLAREGNEDKLLKLIAGTRFYPDAIKEAAKFKHTLLVNKLFEQLSFNPYNTITGLTIPQLALVNSALEGYSSGLHFAEVKNMVSLGGNIFHGLNALISESLLTEENVFKLIDCAKDEVQKTTLCDRVENTFDIKCHPGVELSEASSDTKRLNH
ncbi:hypothetical protein [Legionella quateirensis]|uniref:Uncharacterized protein n=1 Tax=Legionella quateirensis TaxID=45072 RepID=A0A378KTW1_9GAMM|nr:hypothetical protein [Legionella quateirensis]KTD50968.1 hypothetical protein Lqua_1195 [Legionella quateirensis]STY17786.1 Uncharacterised protein [Legionella quateirensis]